MKLKLVSALPGPVLDSLEDLIKPLYTKPGMRIVGITEIAHVHRIEVAPGEDKEPEVHIGLKMLEIAHGDQVDPLHRAALALKVQRTAEGTLDEDIDAIQLNKHLLETLSDSFALREVARQRAAMVHAADVLRRLEYGTFEAVDMRKQCGKLGRIIKAALEFQEPDEDEVP